MSECLDYADGDIATAKQGCEQKAFHRLARRLKRGVRGFIQYLLQTDAGPWLDPDTVRARLAAPFQLRLC